MPPLPLANLMGDISGSAAVTRPEGPVLPSGSDVLPSDYVRAPRQASALASREHRRSGQRGADRDEAGDEEREPRASDLRQPARDEAAERRAALEGEEVERDHPPAHVVRRGELQRRERVRAPE